MIGFRIKVARKYQSRRLYAHRLIDCGAIRKKKTAKTPQICSTPN